MKRSLRFALLAVGVLSLAALPVLASEGGSEAPENTPLGWTFRIINFLILFGGLLYLLLKKAPAAFRGRAERIVGAISEARRVKEEAQQQLRDAETRLARLDQEVAELRAAAQQDGLAEAERIRALAREEETKIRAAAAMEIEAAERASRMELKALAAQLAVTRAESIVKGRMTPDTQAALIRAFVENLGRAH